MRNFFVLVGEAPYKCEADPNCTEVFWALDNQYRHHQAHIARMDNRYKCTFGDCPTGFSRRNNRDRHMIFVHKVCKFSNSFHKMLFCVKF